MEFGADEEYLEHCEELKIRMDSILDVFHLREEQLDLKYLQGCRDIYELETIMLALECVEAKYFPGLYRFVQEKLYKLDPNNINLEEFREGISQYNAQSKELHVQKCVNNFGNHGPRTLKCEICNYDSWDKNATDTSYLEALMRNTKLSEEPELGIVERQQQINENVDLEEKVKYELMATQLKDIGNESFKNKQYEHALYCFTMSIKYYPTIHSYNNRALTYIKLKDYESAINDCTKILTVDPNNTKALYRKANAFKFLKKYGQAIETIKKLIRYSPCDNDAHKLHFEIRRLQKEQRPTGHSVRLKVTKKYRREYRAREKRGVLVPIAGTSTSTPFYKMVRPSHIQAKTALNNKKTNRPSDAHVIDLNKLLDTKTQEQNVDESTTNYDLIQQEKATKMIDDGQGDTFMKADEPDAHVIDLNKLLDTKTQEQHVDESTTNYDLIQQEKATKMIDDGQGDTFMKADEPDARVIDLNKLLDTKTQEQHVDESTTSYDLIQQEKATKMIDDGQGDTFMKADEPDARVIDLNKLLDTKTQEQNVDESTTNYDLIQQEKATKMIDDGQGDTFMKADEPDARVIDLNKLLDTKTQEQNVDESTTNYDLIQQEKATKMIDDGQGDTFMKADEPDARVIDLNKLLDTKTQEQHVDESTTSYDLIQQEKATKMIDDGQGDTFMKADEPDARVIDLNKLLDTKTQEQNVDESTTNYDLIQQEKATKMIDDGQGDTFMKADEPDARVIDLNKLLDTKTQEQHVDESTTNYDLIQQEKATKMIDDGQGDTFMKADEPDARVIDLNKLLDTKTQEQHVDESTTNYDLIQQEKATKMIDDGQGDTFMKADEPDARVIDLNKLLDTKTQEQHVDESTTNYDLIQQEKATKMIDDGQGDTFMKADEPDARVIDLNKLLDTKTQEQNVDESTTNYDLIQQEKATKMIDDGQGDTFMKADEPDARVIDLNKLLDTKTQEQHVDESTTNYDLIQQEKATKMIDDGQGDTFMKADEPDARVIDLNKLLDTKTQEQNVDESTTNYDLIQQEKATKMIDDGQGDTFMKADEPDARVIDLNKLLDTKTQEQHVDESTTNYDLIQQEKATKMIDDGQGDTFMKADEPDARVIDLNKLLDTKTQEQHVDESTTNYDLIQQEKATKMIDDGQGDTFMKADEPDARVIDLNKLLDTKTQEQNVDESTTNYDLIQQEKATKMIDDGQGDTFMKADEPDARVIDLNKLLDTKTQEQHVDESTTNYDLIQQEKATKMIDDGQGDTFMKADEPDARVIDLNKLLDTKTQEQHVDESTTNYDLIQQEKATKMIDDGQGDTFMKADEPDARVIDLNKLLDTKTQEQNVDESTTNYDLIQQEKATKMIDDGQGDTFMKADEPDARVIDLNKLLDTKTQEQNVDESTTNYDLIQQEKATKMIDDGQGDTFMKADEPDARVIDLNKLLDTKTQEQNVDESTTNYDLIQQEKATKMIDDGQGDTFMKADKPDARVIDLNKLLDTKTQEQNVDESTTNYDLIQQEKATKMIDDGQGDTFMKADEPDARVIDLNKLLDTKTQEQHVDDLTQQENGTKITDDGQGDTLIKADEPDVNTAVVAEGDRMPPEELKGNDDYGDDFATEEKFH